MHFVDIQPVTRSFRKTLRIPGSKSITNRALPLAALARGTSTLTGALLADDTRQMIAALQTLGVPLAVDEPNHTITLTGCGTDIPNKHAALSCGNSGTTIRFLAALLATAQGTYELDGIARMRQRPIDQLVDQLRTLGAAIDYAQQPGYPPIILHAHGLAGGGCRFEDARSSQYISAILMAAPYAAEPVTLQLLGPITSEPYINMTLRMMEQFGIAAQVHDQCSPAGGQSATPSRILQIPTGQYKPRDYAIEPDASNASYFLAAAALCPGSSLTIEGLGKGSLQGDVAFADVLHQMGATLVFGRDFVTISAPSGGTLQGLDLDMNHIPDMVQTLAVVALFATGPTTIRNVANLRIKETDRLAALETELAKFGAKVATTAGSITIEPPETLTPPPEGVATYDDHRMAMAFAIAGLRIPGVRIQDPQCTRKTYPEFFDDFRTAVQDL
jgi:3-phosphoshikimate 1-carboxyvinyltransferase